MEGNDWERLIQSLIKQDILHSPDVIKAMRSIPRHEFLPENMRSYGAEDTPLPIGHGQTVSAPHSPALTAELGETWFQ